MIKPLLAVALLLGAAQSNAPVHAQSLQTVSPAQMKKIIAGQKGRPIVVNVWATWCPPCAAELPALARLQRVYARRGLSLLLVSGDDSKTRAQVKPLLKKSGLARSYIISGSLDRWGKGFDPKARDFLLPRTFVYNKRGQRVATYEVPKTFAQLEAIVKPLLK